MNLRSRSDSRWDMIALGEVMLRLDPGEGRISTTRLFNVWEGGGEYNVARGLKRCFGLHTAVVTALVDNPVGRLVQDLIYQGGVDQSLVMWQPDDGVGRSVRNGLNFTERGFGIRGAIGCSDRGHTAVSQLKPGSVDWNSIFSEGCRWFHTGGIFAALGESTPEVAQEAMEAAKTHGVIVSYDLNYRPSLWKGNGGSERARQVNRELVRHVDVLFGNEEDFTVALGYEVGNVGEGHASLEAESYRAMIERVLRDYPGLHSVATTLRVASSATRNDWSALLVSGGELYRAPERKQLEILDRVGGGDSFAAGLIYGYLAEKGPQWSVECGAAHGALAMTTPGDTTMASLEEVEKAMKLGTARVER